MKIIIKKFISGEFEKVDSIPLCMIRQIKHNENGYEFILFEGEKFFEKECILEFDIK